MAFLAKTILVQYDDSLDLFHMSFNICSSDALWHRDVFGMMHQYSCTLYRPISTAKIPYWPWAQMIYNTLAMLYLSRSYYIGCYCPLPMIF